MSLRAFALVLLLPLAAQAADGPSTAELAASARAALSAGRRDLAIYYYRQASLKDPRRLDWRVWLADAYLKRGNLELAEEEAKAILAMDPNNETAKSVMAAVVAPTPTPVPQEVADAEISSVPFPEPSRDPLPKCNAVWAFGDGPAIAEKLNAHNQNVAKAQSMGVVFIPGGELSINPDNGKVSMTLDLAKALDVAERCIGDVRVLPVIKGRSRGASKVSLQEWERVGRELAAKIEDDRRLGGLQFDLNPQATQLFPLYAMTKKYTTKPVTVAVRDWNRLLFKYVDVVVLKCFDFSSGGTAGVGAESDSAGAGLATSLQGFANGSQPLARSFMIDARNMGGKAFIGIPAAATASEFETISFTSGQPGSRGTGLQMYKDYFVNALYAIERALISDDPAYMGAAIWGIHPAGGVKVEGMDRWTFPSEISSEILERMKFPLVDKR